jgi:TetR/AcrR family transcriptional regulator
MTRLVLFTGRVWMEHPEFMRLVHSENLHDARHIRASGHIARLYNPLLDTLRDLLSRGEKAGVFRPDVDPVELYISITSLSAHYLSNHRTLDAVLGARPLTRERVRRRLDHAADMVLAWLRKPAEGAGKKAATARAKRR